MIVLTTHGGEKGSQKRTKKYDNSMTAIVKKMKHELIRRSKLNVEPMSQFKRQ